VGDQYDWVLVATQCPLSTHDRRLAVNRLRPIVVVKAAFEIAKSGHFVSNLNGLYVHIRDVGLGFIFIGLTGVD